MVSYEVGEKAAEVELLKERVQLLEEEVKVQEGKASEGQFEVDKLKKEGQSVVTCKQFSLLVTMEIFKLYLT